MSNKKERRIIFRETPEMKEQLEKMGEEKGLGKSALVRMIVRERFAASVAWGWRTSTLFSSP